MMSSHNDIICDIWCDSYQNASDLMLILDMTGYTIGATCKSMSHMSH
jgi:hypothetical protein